MRISRVRFSAFYKRRALRLFFLVSSFVLLVGLRVIGQGVSSLRVDGMTCEFRESPLGIDRLQPRLGWRLKATHPRLRNLFQSAYEILVASAPELLTEDKADCWRSGKVVTAENNNRDYKGSALTSGTTYYWKIRVWDQDGKPSDWSLPDQWTMGVLTPSDWRGQWIGDSKPDLVNDSLLFGDNPAPVFRKEFEPAKKIRKALLFMTGLGYYEATLNGKKVGDHYLDPGWTDYRKTVFYNTYDVTSLVTAGKNCMGVELGNGWYNVLPLRLWGRINMRKVLEVGAPRFLTRLVIYYADNTEQSVVSDGSWKVSDGPVVRNNVYIGSTVDQRRTGEGWALAGYADASWRKVSLMSPPGGQLLSAQQPPIQSGKPIQPSSIRRLEDGKWLADMGRNFGGVVRLTASGKKNDRVRLRYGEILNKDGSLDVMTSVAGQVKSKGSGGPGAPDIAWQEDNFILSGEGVDTLFPKFTFHGFRFVEIDGYPGTLTTEGIQGIPLSANNYSAGWFDSDDTLYKQIQTASVNTFLSNLFSVQSDCPHREKLGYGGDIVATSEALMANFDMHDFYSKTVQDYTDDVQGDGAMPETAPFVGISDEGLTATAGPIGWGTVYPQLLYQLYQYYGDRELIAAHYQTAKNWVDFLAVHANDYTIQKGIGDHESLDPKQVEVSGTAFFFYNACLLEKLAILLDKKEDADHFHLLAGRIKDAFQRKFYNPETGEVGIHTQANQTFALYFHLLPPAAEEKALAVLRNEISRKNNHLSTGIFGTKFLLEVLSEHSMGALADEITHQKDFPGWGYMLANGATTLWEHWAYSDNTFSHNHPMFGSISGWFYKYVAGIRPDSDAVAYNKVVIQPAPSENRHSASAMHTSPQGNVGSLWLVVGNNFYFEVFVPVNTTATVWIPAATVEEIRESGKTLAEKGIRVLSVRKGWVVCQTGSGTCHFTSNISGDGRDLIRSH